MIKPTQRIRCTLPLQQKTINIAEPLQEKINNGCSFITYSFDDQQKSPKKCLNILLFGKNQKHQSQHVSPRRQTDEENKDKFKKRMFRLDKELCIKKNEEKQQNLFSPSKSYLKNKQILKTIFSNTQKTKNQKLNKIKNLKQQTNLNPVKYFKHHRVSKSQVNSGYLSDQDNTHHSNSNLYIKLHMHKIFQFTINQTPKISKTKIRLAKLKSVSKSPVKIMRNKHQTKKKIQQFFLYSRQLKLKQKIKKHLKQFGEKNRGKQNTIFLTYFPHTDYELALKQFLNRQQKIQMDHNCKSLEVSFHCEYDIETKTLRQLPSRDYNFLKKNLYKIPPRAHSCVNFTDFNRKKYNVSISREQLISAILKAKNDNRIKGVLLDDLQEKIDQLKQRRNTINSEQRNSSIIFKCQNHFMKAEGSQKQISNYFNQVRGEKIGCIKNYQNSPRSSNISSDDQRYLKEMLTHIEIPEKQSPKALLIKNSKEEATSSDAKKNIAADHFFECMNLDSINNDIKEWLRTEKVIKNHVNKLKNIQEDSKILPIVQKVRNIQRYKKSTIKIEKKIKKIHPNKLSINLPDIRQIEAIAQNKQKSVFLEQKKVSKVSKVSKKVTIKIDQNSIINLNQNDKDKSILKSYLPQVQHPYGDTYQHTQIKQNQSSKIQIVNLIQQQIWKKLEKNIDTNYSNINQEVYAMSQGQSILFQTIQNEQTLSEVFPQWASLWQKFPKNYLAAMHILIELGPYALMRIIQLKKDVENTIVTSIYLHFFGIWHEFRYNKPFSLTNKKKQKFFTARCILLRLYEACFSILQRYKERIKVEQFSVDWYLKLFTGQRVITFKKRSNLSKQLNYHYEKQHNIFVLNRINQKSISLMKIVKMQPQSENIKQGGQNENLKSLFVTESLTSQRQSHQLTLSDLMKEQMQLISISTRIPRLNLDANHQTLILRSLTQINWSNCKFSSLKSKITIISITAESSTAGSFTVYSAQKLKNRSKPYRATLVLCKQIKKAIKLPGAKKQTDDQSMLQNSFEIELKEIGRVCERMKYDNIYFECNIHGKYLLYLYLDLDSDEELILSYEGRQTISVNTIQHVLLEEQMIIKLN